MEAGLVQASSDYDPVIDDSPEAVSLENDMIQRLRARRDVKPCGQLQPVLLVSSSGYGVLDSGCWKTIIGIDTLKSFEELWKLNDTKIPEHIPERNSFWFGNGETEVSEYQVPMPVRLAGGRGVIMASIVKGNAPLLVSRNALQMLKANIEFSSR